MPKILKIKDSERYEAEGAIGANLAVVEGTSDGQVTLPGGADVGAFVGVSLAALADGEEGDIQTEGLAKATASAAISRGDKVSIAGTSGKFKTAAPATGANSHICGQAVSAASADGDIFYFRIERSVMQGA